MLLSQWIKQHVLRKRKQTSQARHSNFKSYSGSAWADDRILRICLARFLLLSGIHAKFYYYILLQQAQVSKLLVIDKTRKFFPKPGDLSDPKVETRPLWSSTERIFFPSDGFSGRRSRNRLSQTNMDYEKSF